MSTNNRTKGLLAEKRVLQWLKKEPQFKAIENIQSTNYNKMGVDLEGFLGENKIAIQVKNWDETINLKDIYSFLHIMRKDNNYHKGILINTGKGKITSEAIDELKSFEDKVTFLNNVLINQNKSNFNSHILREYQEEAVKAALKHYQEQNHGILEMACGTGKTLVAKNIMKKLLPQGGLVFYFVPWLNLLEQSIQYFNDDEILAVPICSTKDYILNKNKILEEDNIYNVNMTDLRHILNIKSLNEYKKKYKYIIIFCTYKSYEILSEKQKNKQIKEADFMICDEAHHTVYEHDIQNKEFTIHKDIKAKKILFMTATVKIYKKTKKNDIDICDMNNKKIFGDIFYSLDLGKAIDKDILCDYQIFNASFISIEESSKIDSALTPEIKKNFNFLNIENYKEKQEYKKLTKEGTIKKKIQNLREKAIVEKRLAYIAQIVGIYKIMEDIHKKNSYNGKSTIAFVSNKSERRAFHISEFMKSILKYLKDLKQKSYFLQVDHIEGTMNPQQRQEKLQKLVNETPFLLWNCRCLTEGIDIPQCDTVIFFDYKESYIDIIQSLGRALRKDSLNPDKIANIIFPFDFENSYKKGISFKNKDFFKIISSILITDKRSKNINNNNITSKIEFKKTNENNNLKIPKQKKIIISEKDEKFQKNVDLCYKHIRYRIRKMASISWKNLVLQLKKTLEEIQKIIEKESVQEFLQKIKEEFGTVLNVDESALAKEKVSSILAQYIIFCPILKKIYNVKFSLSNSLNDYLKKLKVYQKVNQKAKEVINLFCKTLDFEYHDNITDKEHIFTQIYNDVLKEIDPELTIEHGMWYTPEKIVKILWDILKKVGKLNFENKLYHIIDPASGTASFIVHFLRNILSSDNKKLINEYYDKYIHLREINFLAYMISAFRVAAAVKKTNLPKNIHWGDTLKNESKQKNPINEQYKNNKKHYQIIITNPPWKVGQKRDKGAKKNLYKRPSNNKKNNEEYWVDERIEETFIANTDKKNVNSLYNMYRRFVRWSLDHIDKKGWLAMVLPNSFLFEGVEGFRYTLTQECKKIYIVNLKGAAGAKVDITKEGGNIFNTETQSGNCQGTVLLLCYKDKESNITNKNSKTYYHKVPNNLSSEEKIKYLQNEYQNENFFQEITLDEEKRWFYKSEEKPKTWQSLTKRNILIKNNAKQNFYFQTSNDGMSSSCDEFVYDSNYNELKNKMLKFIDFYNKCCVNQKIIENPKIIKWHEKLRNQCLKNKKQITFNKEKIIKTLKKPFDKQFLYFDSLIIENPRKQNFHYNKENISICVSYSQNYFECLIVDNVPSKSLLYTTHCYPMSELIPKIPYKPKEWMAILYALFNHDGYRKVAKNFLKNHLPTIPPLTEKAKTLLLTQGQKLIDLHLNYENLPPCRNIIPSNIQDKTQIPNNFIQYHKSMPYIPNIALEYKMFEKPILYNLRKSHIFTQLVTMAIKTTEIKQQINKIKLNL